MKLLNLQGERDRSEMFETGHVVFPQHLSCLGYQADQVEVIPGE